MSTPEGRVKDKVKRRLTAEFPLCYRFMPVQNGMGAPALDFYFCIDGVFVGIETKKTPPSGSRTAPAPTPRQRTTMEDITTAGGLAFLVYDDASLDRTVEAIKKVLPWR